MNYLSKSDYMKFLIHPAYLWYQKNDRNKLPEFDENDQFVFQQGKDFEAYAKELFPKGEEIEGMPWEFDILIEQTKRLLERKVPAIFEATFMTDSSLLCRVDILERTDNGFIVNEVKSSTSVKDKHLKDVTFQVIALEEAGYNVEEVNLLYVNKYYKKNGEIRIDGYVNKDNVSQEVDELKPKVKKEIKEALKVMIGPKPEEHPALAGDFRTWLDIYKHIHPSKIKDDSILNLAQTKPQQILTWYHDGIEKITDLKSTEGLNARQKAQVEANKNGKPIILHEKISNFIDTLEYPLYFLDYETVAHAVPIWDGTKPYQQIPFQYSLHVLDEPNGELNHTEYLYQGKDLPVEELASKLISEIGTTGSVLVWYDNFEKSCNKLMGQLVPELKEDMAAINKRVVDLMVPFSRHWYVDSKFNGSASIKAVLPVLVPELSYKELGIQEGGAAQRSWYETLSLSDGEEKQQIFDDLIEYCKLDTLAMVEILRALEGALKQEIKQEAHAQTSLF